jgi:hypothetical protein
LRSTRSSAWAGNCRPPSGANELLGLAEKASHKRSRRPTLNAGTVATDTRQVHRYRRCLTPPCKQLLAPLPHTKRFLPADW